MAAILKTNGIVKKFIVDTGSPISIKMADDNILKKNEKVKHRHQDRKRKQHTEMQVLITERYDS